MVTVTVKGYEQAKEILDQMPTSMRESILKATLKRSSKPVVTAAQNTVPQDWGVLREKIATSYVSKKNLAPEEVAINVAPIFGKTRSGKINSYYGRMVHNGTRRGIKANPFIERAYNSSNGQVKSIFGDELATVIQNFVKRKFKPIS